jgi:hypothetical protein
LVKPDAFKALPAAVMEDDTDDGPAVGQVFAVYFHDLAQDSLQGTCGQIGDRPDIAQIIVLAREMKE